MTSNILNRGMSEAEAREKLDRLDRRSWFGARHADGGFGIIAGRDGREVCRCKTEQDRDLILKAVKAFVLEIEDPLNPGGILAL